MNNKQPLPLPFIPAGFPLSGVSLIKSWPIAWPFSEYQTGGDLHFHDDWISSPSTWETHCNQPTGIGARITFQPSHPPTCQQDRIKNEQGKTKSNDATHPKLCLLKTSEAIRSNGLERNIPLLQNPPRQIHLTSQHCNVWNKGQTQKLHEIWWIDVNSF